MPRTTTLPCVEDGFTALLDSSVPEDWSPEDWPVRRPSRLRAAVLCAFAETCAICSGHATRIRHLKPHRTVWPGFVAALCEVCARRKRLPEDVLQAAARSKATLLRRMTGLDLPSRDDVQDAFLLQFVADTHAPPLPEAVPIGQAELREWRGRAIVPFIQLHQKLQTHRVWRTPLTSADAPPFGSGSLFTSTHKLVCAWLERALHQRNGTWEALHEIGIDPGLYTQDVPEGRRTFRIVHAATHLKWGLTTWFVRDDHTHRTHALFVRASLTNALSMTRVAGTRIRVTVTRTDQWPGYHLSDAIVPQVLRPDSPFRAVRATRFRRSKRLSAAAQAFISFVIPTSECVSESAYHADQSSGSTLPPRS